jgi:hypothetical protein
MGINVRIETERGETIEEVLDPSFLTKRLLPPLDDARSYCLRFVDPAGDAVFNQQQLPILVDEVRRQLATVGEARSRDHGERVLKLIESALGRVHVYVRFLGD